MEESTSMLWWYGKWEGKYVAVPTNLCANCSFQINIQYIQKFLTAWQHTNTFTLPSCSCQKCEDIKNGVLIFFISVTIVAASLHLIDSPEPHLQSRRVFSAVLGLGEGISPHQCVCWGKPRRGSRSSLSPEWDRARWSVLQHLLNACWELKVTYRSWHCNRGKGSPNSWIKN